MNRRRAAVRAHTIVAAASDGAALGGKDTGGLARGGGQFGAAPARQFPGLGDAAVLTANQQHLDGERSRLSVRADALEHNHPPVWSRSFGAPAQDRGGFAIGPVVQNAPQDVKIGAGGERVEKLCPALVTRIGYPAASNAVAARSTVFG